MKILTKLILLFFFISIFSSVSAQSPFSKVFTISGYRPVVNDMIRLVDGGLMVCINKNHLAVITRLDSTGNIVWSKEFGTGAFQGYNSLVSITDSTFLLAGNFLDSSDPDVEFQFTKIDIDGNIIWDNKVASVDDQYPKSMKRTSDGGYIIVGNEMDPLGQSSKAFAIKLNSSGSIVWYNTYSISPNIFTFANSIAELSGGGYMLVGTMGDGPPNRYLGYMAKLNSSGAVVSTSTYSIAGLESFISGDIIITPLKIYLLFNLSKSFELLKFEMNGTLLWERKFDKILGSSGCQLCTSTKMTLLQNGNLALVTGEADITTSPSCLFSFDANGNYVWSKTLDYSVHKVLESSDQGLFLIGSTQDTTGRQAIGLIKTNSAGDGILCTTPNVSWPITSNNIIIGTTTMTSAGKINSVSQPTTSTINSSIDETLSTCIGLQTTIIENKLKELVVFPNPVHRDFTLSWEKTINSSISVRIFDQFGRMLFDNDFNSKNSNEITINLNRAIAAGIYMLQLKSETESFNTKLLIAE